MANKTSSKSTKVAKKAAARRADAKAAKTCKNFQQTRLSYRSSKL